MSTSGSKSATRPRRSAAETREHILAVAADRFYWEGVHATGVDAIAAHAEVAPTTLYRLFSSKDDLVAAYVARCSDAYKARLTAASAPTGPTARERILAVFEAFTAEALSDSCRGCPFLMVLAEFPDPSHPAHVEAVAHKTWVRDLLYALVCELSADNPIGDPAGLTDELALIAEGIYGSVQSLGASGPARLGRTCAEILLDVASSAFLVAD